MKIILKEDFDYFVNALITDNSWNVVGVKLKGNKFTFGPLESANELRLDYDATFLRPKKYFFPQHFLQPIFGIESVKSEQLHCLNHTSVANRYSARRQID